MFSLDAVALPNDVTEWNLLVLLVAHMTWRMGLILASATDNANLWH